MVREGANDVPLGNDMSGGEVTVVVEIVVLSFAVTNRLHLHSLVLNSVRPSVIRVMHHLAPIVLISFVQSARLHPYTPPALSFQFIGDSLASVRRSLFLALH